MRYLEWAQFASHETPITYSAPISRMISLALFLNFWKGRGCLEIAFEICWRILTLEPPWLIILFRSEEATGRKSEKRRIYTFSSYQSVRVTLWYPSYLIFCSSKEAEKILSLVGIQTFPGAGDSKWFNSIRWLSFHVSWWSTNMNWTHRTHCKYLSFSHPTVGRSQMWNMTYQPVIFFVRG